MAIRKRINKDGKITGWQVTVEGVRGPNGERKRFSKTLPTKKEAQAAELEMLNQLVSGGIQRVAPMTTATWINTWLNNHKPNIAATTRAGYEEKIRNYIIPAFGPIPISNLQAAGIQAWVKGMSTQGLAPRTIKSAYQCLYSSLKTAVILRMIPHNPCEGVVLPTIEPYAIQVYDNAEIQAALNAAEGHNIYLLVFLALAVGLRRGELCALKWSHINFDKRIIHIIESRATTKGKVFTKDPKSHAGRRTITVGPNTCEILKQAKAEYEEKKEAYGQSFCKEDYVICKKNGYPYHPDSLTQKWDRFMAKHNLRHIRLHDLRHTCATAMAENHIDTKTIQVRIGHASSKTTTDIYIHRTQAMDDNAADIMDNVIFQ